MEYPLWLIAAFFGVALAYSSVGFAGGSSYLLVLSLAGFSHGQSAPIALLANVVVSSLTWAHFARAGHFRWRNVLPFLLFSLPAAYVGSIVSIDKHLFWLLLGVSLFLAGLRLFFLRKDGDAPPARTSTARLWSLALPAGGLMGFVSGLLGIGGGIFLSPFLIFSNIAGVKEASAAASFFILANSLSGLAGKAAAGGFSVGPALVPLLVSAACGGWLGSLWGSGAVPERRVARTLALMSLVLSVNFLLKALA